MNEMESKPAGRAALLEPGAGACYSHAWDKMWNYFLELLLMIAVMIVAAIPLTWRSMADEIGAYPGFLIGFFSLAYLIMLYGPLEYGLDFAFLKAARSEKVDTKDLLASFKNYFNAVLANMLVMIAIGIGIVFLVIPGIYLACKLAFVPYIVVDRRLDAIEAFKESWRMTDGHALDIFVIGLLAVPICIAGLILLGVGLIASTMWIGLALASMYHAVAEREKEAG